MALFEYEGLSFRLVEEGDLKLIVDLRNDRSTWPALGDPMPLKIGLQKAWLDGLNRSSDRHYFSVEDASDWSWVGVVRMDQIDLQNRSVRIGADVAVQKRRCGFGVRIYNALKRYCFDDLGMHRVWLLVLETNRVARALYRKVGFSEEGRMKKAVWRDGRWVDYISMSILREGKL